MKTKRTFKGTRYACYGASLTQAIVNNLAPLLFVIFQDSFDISYGRISWLVFLNFIVQLAVDLLAVHWADRIGYRTALAGAHLFAFSGLILLGTLPWLLPDAYAGLVASVVTYAAGSGLMEVLTSPVVDSLPGGEKASAMSILHSFYCWGHVAVVLISTLLLRMIGNDLWFLLPLIWSVLPLINLFNFLQVPLLPPLPEGEKLPVQKLLRSRNFLLALILMLCAGAAELTMAQWASLFAERTLGVSKVAGDLLGPCLFAAFMGLGRTAYGLSKGEKHIKAALKLSAVLCVISYLAASLGRVPAFALAGCSLCGLSVSLMWPGVLSISARTIPGGGTSMFALLAVFGDLGCSFGPWMAGQISSAVQDMPGVLAWFSSGAGTDPALKAGLLAGVIFPVIMLACVMFYRDGAENKAVKSAI